MTAATLLTLHNLSFYLDTLRRVRQNILLGRFEEFRSEVLRVLAASEAEAEGGSCPRL
jgi:tRNA-guanine family transglycosylase